MYIIFNADGSIKKQYLNTFIQQGENNAKSIFVSIDGLVDNDYEISAVATLPDQTNVALYVTTNQTITIDGVLYHGQKVVISKAATILGGIIKINILATKENETIVTYNLYLTVNKTGLGANDPVFMSLDEYQSLLLKVGDVPEGGYVPYIGANNNVDLGEYDLYADRFDAYEKDGEGNTRGLEVTNYGIINYDDGYNGGDFREDTFFFPEYEDIPGHEFTLATESWVNEQNYETANNKVTSISGTSTDTQYPSAKCVYDKINEVKNIALEASNAYFVDYEETVANIKSILNRYDGALYSCLLYSDDSSLDAQTPTNITNAVKTGGYDSVTLQNSIFESADNLIRINDGITLTSGDRYLIIRGRSNYRYIFIRISYASNHQCFNKGDIIYVSNGGVPNRIGSGSVNLYAINNSDVLKRLPFISAIGTDTISSIIQNNIDITNSPIVIKYSGNLYVGMFKPAFNTTGEFAFTKLGTNEVFKSGTIDLSTLTISDIFGTDTYKTTLEKTSNKVTSLSASSTDTEYPSAKVVYDQLATKANKEGVLPSYSVSINDNTLTFINSHPVVVDSAGEAFILKISGGSQSYIGKFRPNVNDPTHTEYAFEFEDLEGRTRFWSIAPIDLTNITFKSIFYYDTYKENYEIQKNKVTSISSSSTNDQYPSAKCVYDELQTKQDAFTVGSGLLLSNNVLSCSNTAGSGTALYQHTVSAVDSNNNTQTIVLINDSATPLATDSDLRYALQSASTTRKVIYTQFYSYCDILATAWVSSSSGSLHIAYYFYGATAVTEVIISSVTSDTVTAL